MGNNGQYQQTNDNMKALIIGSIMGTVFLAIVIVCICISLYNSTNNKMATAYISDGNDTYNTIEPEGKKTPSTTTSTEKDTQYYAVSDYSGINYDSSIDCHRYYSEKGIEYYEESSYLFKNEQLVYNQQFWACKNPNFTDSAKDEVLTKLNEFGKGFEQKGYIVTSSKETNFVYLKATYTVAPKDQLAFKDFSIEYVKNKFNNSGDDGYGPFQCDTKDSL